ncbi:hypothetical protein [Sphingomonas sanxanigenens]|uniref:ATP-grasp domain-containing protein n=1 Tax=Sphingomonas sanxanigenens DSM 19645 = NX02 TaxID=1123269 RepID=W0AKU7_9SPHN|nr:hypothetical protein [Sphingomonas sanxanigenens]AHE56310.1 hypothetical protein NX02_23475 [Sphingomonas sanxanigenens DSM 19645 = NX02]
MAERVLITGARAPVALDIARSFAAAGHEVHMADSAPALIARWSRTPCALHRLPPPRQAPEAFARAVSALVAGLDPVLVVPTCEEVFHLARLGLDRLFAPAPARLFELHAKDRFAALATGLGLTAPETHRLESPAGLAGFEDTASDWVFKPVHSRFGTRARIGPATLDGIVPGAAEPWVAQRRIVGEEVSFYAIAHAGTLAGFAAYRSSWRLGGGAGYAFAALPDVQAQALGEIAGRLAPAVGNGQFACDAIRDRDGRFHLIECNPRATSGAHLFGRGPGLARAMLAGTAVAPVRGLRVHVGPALWWFGMGTALRRGRYRDWFGELRRGRDVVGAPRDRWPIFGAAADSAQFAARALRHRRTLAEQMTADIEWNGEA